MGLDSWATELHDDGQGIPPTLLVTQTDVKTTPNVYTPSLMALNEQIAMDAFHNFVAGSQVAQGMDEGGKIAFYLEYLQQKKQD